MDNQLADNFQAVDNENEADQGMEDCLGNPVIVRRILEHFSSKELLQISLVNKLWKYEARSLISRRGNLIANLKSKQLDGDRCGAVVAFLSDLPKLSAAPFFGIKFDNNFHHARACPCTPGNLVQINEVNLHQLSLKNVSVQTTGSWQEFGRCPGFLLAKNVLQLFCEDLEELELIFSHEQDDYVEKVVKACYFPRLKILKVTCYVFPKIEKLMRALLDRAPNLKMLQTDWNMNSVLSLLQGTSVEFLYTTPVRAPFDEISDNVISGTRFEAMMFEYIDNRFDLERINTIAPILLQASRTTVRFMRMDAVFAGPLMCYGTPLENVNKLLMDMGRLESIDPRILNTVMDFDFTRIFPNLDEVDVAFKKNYWYSLSPQHINALIEQANAVLTEPSLDRAARIRKLSLHFWHPCQITAQVLFAMFPNIEKLDIKTGRYGGPIPFAYIWNWMDLIEINIEGDFLPSTGNLDSVFCGIFPEEVAELRLKDDEYLKQVNIVPVMPAVTCLRNLRTINLRYEHHLGFVDAMFIFSKVTALLAFARQPSLFVKLRLSGLTDPPAMTHLEPYVSVTCDRF